MDRSELIRQAIAKGYEEREKNTIVIEHEGGSDSIIRFYRKNGAIWCKMVCGCISSDSRVYKVDSDRPYIRDHGRYWYLSEREKAIVANL